MLEKMNDFFNGRVRGYEEHQLTAIAYAREFYPFTAECLPDKAGASVLDLGCGTGLELGYYFARNPAAKVTGIDMAGGGRAGFTSAVVLKSRGATATIKATK